MSKGFNVTYEIITEESAEQGDAEERGFLLENVTFREAFGEVFPHGNIEVSCARFAAPPIAGLPLTAKWTCMTGAMKTSRCTARAR